MTLATTSRTGERLHGSGAITVRTDFIGRLNVDDAPTTAYAARGQP